MLCLLQSVVLSSCPTSVDKAATGSLDHGEVTSVGLPQIYRISIRSCLSLTPCKALNVNTPRASTHTEALPQASSSDAAMVHSYEEIIYALSELQSQELSIIRLSEPISAANAPDAPKRTSDVSSDAFEDPSPASLAADLGHYKVYTFSTHLVWSPGGEI